MNDQEAKATSDAHRQMVASNVQAVTIQMLAAIHDKNINDALVGGDPALGYDASPIIQGMIGGAVEFLIRGGADDATIRSLITDTLDDTVAQARFFLEGQERGAVGEGRA